MLRRGDGFLITQMGKSSFGKDSFKLIESKNNYG